MSHVAMQGLRALVAVAAAVANKGAAHAPAQNECGAQSCRTSSDNDSVVERGVHKGSLSKPGDGSPAPGGARGPCRWKPAREDCSGGMNPRTLFIAGRLPPCASDA